VRRPSCRARIASPSDPIDPHEEISRGEFRPIRARLSSRIVRSAGLRRTACCRPLRRSTKSRRFAKKQATFALGYCKLGAEEPTSFRRCQTTLAARSRNFLSRRASQRSAGSTKCESADMICKLSMRASLCDMAASFPTRHPSTLCVARVTEARDANGCALARSRWSANRLPPFLARGLRSRKSISQPR
jgi:hypothetical protein